MGCNSSVVQPSVTFLWALCCIQLETSAVIWHAVPRRHQLDTAAMGVLHFISNRATVTVICNHVTLTLWPLGQCLLSHCHRVYMYQVGLDSSSWFPLRAWTHIDPLHTHTHSHRCHWSPYPMHRLCWCRINTQDIPVMCDCSCRYSSTQSLSVTRFVSVTERTETGGGGARSRGPATAHDGETTVVRTVHAEPSELGRFTSWGTASLSYVGGLPVSQCLHLNWRVSRNIYQ